MDCVSQVNIHSNVLFLHLIKVIMPDSNSRFKTSTEFEKTDFGRELALRFKQAKSKE